MPIPTIDQPDTITDCENNFDVTGTVDPDAEAVNLYVKVGEGESATLFLIGTDSELTPEDGPSTWSISVDPNDPNLGEGTHTLVAKGVIGGEESEESESVTLEIDLTVPPPTIDQPDTVTDCENNFDITGTADTDTETVNLYLKMLVTLSPTSYNGAGSFTSLSYNGVGSLIPISGPTPTLILIGRTSDIDDETGQWTISVDPNNPNLGDGTFTIVVKAVIGGEESAESNPVTLTIDCPEVATTIDDPADGTTIDCEEDLTVSGTFDSETFNSVEIFVDGESAGFAELDGDNWSFVIPADLLGEGDHTIVAEFNRRFGTIYRRVSSHNRYGRMSTTS